MGIKCQCRISSVRCVRKAHLWCCLRARRCLHPQGMRPSTWIEPDRMAGWEQETMKVQCDKSERPSLACCYLRYCRQTDLGREVCGAEPTSSSVFKNIGVKMTTSSSLMTVRFFLGPVFVEVAFSNAVRVSSNFKCKWEARGFSETHTLCGELSALQ